MEESIDRVDDESDERQRSQDKGEDGPFLGSDNRSDQRSAACSEAGCQSEEACYEAEQYGKEGEEHNSDDEENGDGQ